MKIGIILNSNDAEIVWNAFRFGVKALDKNNSVKVFLLGKGVEAEDTKDEKFEIQKVIGDFKNKNGMIFACGTCLKLRNKKESRVCPISTLDEMLRIVEESDRILSF